MRSTLPLLVLLTVCALALAQGQPTGVPSEGDSPASAPLELGRVDGWPLWVESGRAGTASVLLADGSLVWVATEARAASHIARGLAGEQLAACGSAILVVDERSALRRLPRAPDLPVVSATGPAVSRLHRPVCAADGTVFALDPRGNVLRLSRELETLQSARLAGLPDAELVVVELGDTTALAVLSEPTQRYRHGALGDEVEAGALTLLDARDLSLLTTWRPSPPAVIEARRPTFWSAQGEAGVYVTVSDDESGARLVSLAWDGSDLVEVARGEPLGESQRWLHLIGASDGRAYAVHEPRDEGPFVRYRKPLGTVGIAFDDGEPLHLPHSEVASGLVSHVDGERLLDRAALLGPLPEGGELLLVPKRGQRVLVWMRCDDRSCSSLGEVTLPAPLATNLSLAKVDEEVVAVVLADRSGTVWWLPLPLDLADQATDGGAPGR